MERFTIGNVEIVPLLDSKLNMDPCTFFPAYADPLMQQHPHLLDERGLLSASITCYAVRSAGKTLLVDTGIGPRKRARMPRGRLDEALAGQGMRPDEIDIVVHTHLHVDHTGWNTVDEGDGRTRLFFPNARYLIQQAEWDFWVTPEHLAQESRAYLRECVVPVADAGRVDFASGEVAIDENLTFVSTPGHTPGHVSIGVYSAGERGIIAGDVSHHPIHLEHPDWSPGGDEDGKLAAKTRDHQFNEAAADGRLWVANHWPYPGVGHIVRLEGKRVFQAVAPQLSAGRDE